MQVSMQAFARRNDSLRKRIADDLLKRPHEVLYVEEFQNPDRRPGWAKILGKGLTGALNISWNASARMLMVRAIAKKGNTPHELLGTFLAYLFERHGRRIASINIQLR
jgi:hypothetical protein